MNRVLVVDDEPEYLDELVEALDFRGLSAISVGRGAQALDVLKAEPGIRLVLTDLRMPDMDGLTLINTAWAIFPGRQLHFVVMTGHAAEADVAKALRAGAERCFAKPLAFDELIETLLELRGLGHAVG